MWRSHYWYAEEGAAREKEKKSKAGFMGVMTEDMEMIGVTVEDAENWERWKMILLW